MLLFGKIILDVIICFFITYPIIMLSFYLDLRFTDPDPTDTDTINYMKKRHMNMYPLLWLIISILTILKFIL